MEDISLRDKLKYNIDKITVWQAVDGGVDKYNRPIKIWKKTVVAGKWENAVKTMRNMTGDSISSTANVIIPLLLDIKESILIEKGESKESIPSSEARKIITMEEITRIKKAAVEWIYYV